MTWLFALLLLAALVALSWPLGRYQRWAMDPTPDDGSLRYERQLDLGIELYATERGTVVFCASDYIGAPHICEVDGTGTLVRDVRLEGQRRYGAMLVGGTWMAVDRDVAGELDRVLVWRVPGFSTLVDSPGSGLHR